MFLLINNIFKNNATHYVGYTFHENEMSTFGLLSLSSLKIYSENVNLKYNLSYTLQLDYILPK